MSKQTFEAVIETPPKTPGAFVTVPFDVNEVYGRRGQVKVKATFDGHPYRGSLAPMGGGRHVLGIRKDIRKAIGKDIGDKVRVVVERDAEPRVVTVPPDFQQLLNRNKTAKAAFDKLSYTHRKEYVEWIESAQKAETRERRLQKAIGMLLEGIKNP